MKVMAVSCSPREESNCDAIVNKVIQGIKETHRDASINFLKLSKLDLKDCNGCYYCKENGNCNIDDDMQYIYKELYDTDILIFASPIYMGYITGSGKNFIDRFFSLSSGEYEVKIPTGKKVITILTQGHLREDAYRTVMDGINRIFNCYGFETCGRIIGAGTQVNPDKINKNIMDVAYRVGQDL